MSGSCNAGSSIRAIASNGTVTCELDDNTTYTAEGGLNLSGTTLSLASSTTHGPGVVASKSFCALFAFNGSNACTASRAGTTWSLVGNGCTWICLND